MNRVIMSTKKTATAFTAIRIVSAVLSLVLFVIGMTAYAFIADEYPRLDGPKNAALILGLVFLVEGTFSLFNAVLEGQTYVDVYEDRFVGVGKQGLRALSFNVKIEKINNVSIERKTWVQINTDSGVYRITTNKEMAEKIFNHFAELKG